MHLKTLSLYLITMVLISCFASCEPRDEIVTDERSAALDFSTDSILFDTIFTQIGSATRRLYVFNRGKKAVNISQISLGKLSSSPYELIIDGVRSDHIKDKFLRGGDSLLILIRFFADPNGGNQPMVDIDEINFLTNGNLQKVVLQAFGQDVILLNGDSTECGSGGGTVTWSGTKPYLIFSYYKVEEGCVLQIDPGVKIYHYNNAIFYVEGSLQVNGTASEKVEFRAFRPEPSYADVPGQWRGIAFAENSTGNRISHAVIKNAQTGIQFGRPTPSTTPVNFDLQVDHTLIRNMSGYGVLFLTAKVFMENVVVTNCALGTVAAISGGNYLFNFCTFADYANVFSREDPHFILANNFVDASNTVIQHPLNAGIYNSIIYGALDEELLFDFDGNDFVEIKDCILKTKQSSAPLLAGNIFDSPKFKAPFGFDYSLDTLSPAKDAGNQIQFSTVTDDIVGNARDNDPDIGAYERQ